MLRCLDHRAATGSDPQTGDGAGIQIQVPHEFFLKDLKSAGHDLPPALSYGVGMVFFPVDEQVSGHCKRIIEDCIRQLSHQLICFRKVPVDHEVPGLKARTTEPSVWQFFVRDIRSGGGVDALERRLFHLRKLILKRIRQMPSPLARDFYILSLSARTVVYKGQLRTFQLRDYYADLQDMRMESAIAVVHSRFSTNTLPSWRLAHPFRYLSHNGEINTIRGNIIKMRSKEAILESKYFTPEEIDTLLPITDPGWSDSANLDLLVELLVLSGRSLPHALMMLVPQAWENDTIMDASHRAFYEYNANITEGWDGPAALFFTDGVRAGAIVDRNGLRPARYCLTSDNLLIMGSEAGTVQVPPEMVVKKGLLQPGQIIMADLERNQVLEDDQIKREVCGAKPYGKWVRENQFHLRAVPPETGRRKVEIQRVGNPLALEVASGMSEEDVRMLVLPMCKTGKEAMGAMGADIPISPLSDHCQHISSYFKQYFAQVSNPPIDPIRERCCMSLITRVGRARNMLEETPEHARQIQISQPVLDLGDYKKITGLKSSGFDCQHLDATIHLDRGESLTEALDRLCLESRKAVDEGKAVLVLTHEGQSAKRAPIPSLLATGTVHHHLAREKVGSRAGIIVCASDAWEVHHFATLIGFGACAVYPYLTFSLIEEMYEKGDLAKDKPLSSYLDNYITAVGTGILKIMSKMGISTLQSYHAAQIFECVGLSKEVIGRSFSRTVSRIGGLTFKDLEEDILLRHKSAFLKDGRKRLELGGVYQWKRMGEYHLLNPETISLLQKSAILNDYSLFKEYSQLVNASGSNIRHLLSFAKRRPVPLADVEPVETLLTKFTTGAMSFGSISYEAHSTLAIAMNRIGAMSNSGEGGEDPRRFKVKPNGDWENSAVKQIASGRFGVTIDYLNHARELQIKVAQGAKPGEGGQILGGKVGELIARVRNSTPGVGLISPPPHHDIYSMEDLKQLIFELKNSNPQARVCVKLVSKAGVGTIAAGVVKARADVILISGADGGTGASPLSSLRHAGLPWEMGLAETNQTLVRNDLRSRVILQTDGKILTGRDVAIATLLGAEEFGVSTAALVVSGCIMMRKCHLNTCPVGIATQRPELRELFTGKPEHVINFFTFLVRELREIMAALGYTSLSEMVGQSHLLKPRQDLVGRARRLDLSPVLGFSKPGDQVGLYHQISQDHGIDRVLDNKIIKDLEDGGPSSPFDYNICSTDRAVGTLLSGYLCRSSKTFDKKLEMTFHGSAGQSFGAFLHKSLKLHLRGESNDYVGKGLSGGTIIVTPTEGLVIPPHENIIVGNVCMYGATSGEVYINGKAGERFCVRNSGSLAVVEGCGDNGCEYMTGGTVMILGKVGKNFGAGMSGGRVFLFDLESRSADFCNLEMIDLDAPEREDLEEIHRLLTTHLGYTGSPQAKDILDRWSEMAGRFVVVMPHDMKRILGLQRVSAGAA